MDYVQSVPVTSGMNTLPGESAAFPRIPSRIIGNRGPARCSKRKCPGECNDCLGIADFTVHRPLVRFGKRDPVNFDDLGMLMSRRAGLDLGGIKEVQGLREHPWRAQGGAETLPVTRADTGFFYVTKKNPRTKTNKLELKKFDPVARKHVVFKEAKIK